LVDWIRLD